MALYYRARGYQLVRNTDENYWIARHLRMDVLCVD